MYNQWQDPYTGVGGVTVFNHRQFTWPQQESVCFNIILLKQYTIYM